MKKRRQKLSTDLQTIVGRSSADANSSPIPADLMYEIFLRLSPKYIATCRCVSKLWSSILDRQDFTDQFLKQSSVRPQILFRCVEDGQVSFFSSPQTRNPDENTPLTTASYHMTLHLNHVYQIHKPISGLVCIGDFRVLNGRPAMISVICNPTTGQCFTLPRIKTGKKIRKKYEMIIFFGHDPVEKQFKVLSMKLQHAKDDAISKEHQVLTLETGKLSWRMIMCSVPHYPRYSSVCIDGVMYYRATPIVFCSPAKVMIICFDVRSEKFSFIKAKAFTRALCREATLINFNGKLASLRPIGSDSFDRTCTSFEMWVLDDPKKKEWSMHSYTMPPQWQTIVPKFMFCVGATGSNEIVFSDGPDTFYVPNPFYVFYYSLERGTIRRVEIQGMGAFMKGRVFTSLNYVEDVKRL